jgi:multicomponent Na+:H+ antiporter subunit D
MERELLPALVFAPLLAAAASAVLPARCGRIIALATALLMPLMLWPLSAHCYAHGRLSYALAGLDAPLGIHLRVDGLSMLLLWLVAIIMLAATAHAWRSIGAKRDARRFWPAWLVLLTGLNAMLVSADLFNLYVGLELLTLSAVALVAYEGSSEALRAAMRYLLLAMLASLAYLLGVAMVYAATGTLDLGLIAQRLPGKGVAAPALVLMTGGLLVKSAIFPLHGWLPPAHGSAPGPVSAVLSALVVKASLYLIYRLWFELPDALPAEAAGVLMASLGVGALLFGSWLALRQQRLKRVIAWSTVAQLGYLMFVFAIPVHTAWQGTVYHMLSHGLAKAAMFLAAANLMKRLGSDRLERLPGSDRRMPVSVFAFGLAGVSLMGMPPSGGFISKWLLLSAAWQTGGWFWLAMMLLGSLLAAGYVFRVLALMYKRPAYKLEKRVGRQAGLACEVSALALALLAIALGFASAPILELLGPAEEGGSP